MIFIKRVSWYAAQTLISVMLLISGYFALSHGSSAAFELGLAMLFFGLLHWVWWPSCPFDKDSKRGDV